MYARACVRGIVFMHKHEEALYANKRCVVRACGRDGRRRDERRRDERGVMSELIDDYNFQYCLYISDWIGIFAQPEMER